MWRQSRSEVSAPPLALPVAESGRGTPQCQIRSSFTVFFPTLSRRSHRKRTRTSLALLPSARQTPRPSLPERKTNQGDGTGPDSLMGYSLAAARTRRDCGELK